MAVKKIGISRDLVIHPGETIADVLVERGISQVELATSTGVSPAYVSNVIAGKKDISAKFAFALEYALGVPKSFWINLQANYDAQLLEVNEKQTITTEERDARDELKDVVRMLRKEGRMPENEKKDDSILSLRRALMVSNISNVKDMVPSDTYKLSKAIRVNPYVLGAWIRLCQISVPIKSIEKSFDLDYLDALVSELKNVMTANDNDLRDVLKNVFSRYGIVFSVMQDFKGAPAQGYISPRNDGSYQMVVTVKNEYADSFWFSIFHELGHIVNGDIGRKSNYIDDGLDIDKEKLADKFAYNKLISELDYQIFINEKSFGIESIKRFAHLQNVIPYIVIDRLQRENILDYNLFSDYRSRYEWSSN